MASQISHRNKEQTHDNLSHTTSAHFAAIIREGETDLRQYLRLINNCDEHDPLLSETPLGHRLASVPLESLGPGELSHLQLALNVEQLIPTASGLARDYRGLAELMGFSSLELESRFGRSHNPTKSLLDAYVLQSRLRGQQAASCSLKHLLKMLESIERFDIIDDLLPQLVDWAAGGDNQQVVAVASSSPEIHISRPGRHDNQIVGSDRASVKASQLYDAFVCFAPEDFRYAQELIGLLEAHNRRLVTVDNLLPGRFEYDAIVQMIATECRKVIVILTPNYLLSKDCEFQTKFANELAIKSGWNPRLIPVLCEPLDDTQLPYLLRFMSKIDMTPRLGNQPAWQLKKLLYALDHDATSATASAGSLTAPNDHLFSAESQVQRDTNYYDRDSSPIIDLALSQTGTTSVANLTTTSGLSLTTTSSSSSSLRVPSPGGWTSVSGAGHALLDGNQAGPATPPSMNPLTWYKSFKQRVRSGFRGAASAGEECAAAAAAAASSSAERVLLSSRAILLPPGDSDEDLSLSSSSPLRFGQQHEHRKD